MRVRSAVVAGVACLALAGLLAGSALGVSIPIQTLEVELDGTARPATLPANGPVPLTMTLEGRISEPGTVEGHPPALRTLALQFDRAGAIFTKGLPVCNPPLPESGWDGCGRALVGHGEVEIDAAGAEGGPPFRVKAPLQVFNGPPRGGRPVLTYVVPAHLPAPTDFVTHGVVEPGHGRYGTQTTIRIPTSYAGDGSLVRFRATIGKAWTYRGHRVSLLAASCPRGRLAVHAEFGFAGGLKFEGQIVKPCREVDSAG